METKQMEFSQRLDVFSTVAWDQIPDLGLYMDQVMTYLEKTCGMLFAEGDKAFTPSMINNYVKFGLVSRPDGKKYGREQLAQLLMICTLKQAASVDGMKKLLQPPDGLSFQAHYEEYCRLQRKAFDDLHAELPLSSAMACAVRGAAYHFLCNAVLAKEPESEMKHKQAKAEIEDAQHDI